jgi:uncharacterized protein
MRASLERRLAQALSIEERQVKATIELLDAGSTVPFIARYRKEVTGSLDDTQLRALEEQLRYLRELDERRGTILKSIEEQGKLTDELAQALWEADSKQRLEDLYLPYKPKRRTKGQIAIEAGLEPLADALFAHPERAPEQQASEYIDPEKGIADVKAALEGAKYILMERFAEDANLLAALKSYLWQQGYLSVRVMTGKEQEGQKFKDYFEHDEPLKQVPSHRALAFFRGRNEGILSLSLVAADPNQAQGQGVPEQMVAEHFAIQDQGRPGDAWLREVVRWTWRIKLHTHIETELLGRLRDAAEKDAIQVFAHNLKDLLLAAPAGSRATLGLDPGFRTGVKVAVIDATGKVLDQGAIFPHEPQRQWKESIAKLSAWVQQYAIELIAIGNGTASRETDRLVADLMKLQPHLNITKVMVNEAGASVYSASESAAKELPDLDVTIRGAVSIARRLQDPLAELVKIDPKSIGVGQYQHDVSQVELARTLDAVVEDCVNAVGVDLNTASAPLLARVAGLNLSVANNIVQFRDENGPFNSRKSLIKVPRLGAKTFEQAAGFLRIPSAENPLDASAVHPEAYPLVERMAKAQQREVRTLMGDAVALKAINAASFVDEHIGLPTIRDILTELEKPGRDPRPEFSTANFQEGVEEIKDLHDNMILEGVVTNVTNFGAFVDVGVHQDGLVHISALSNQFVKDPRTVVKAGDIVKVKVMEVEVARKRIALSMRLTDTAEDYQAERQPNGGRDSSPTRSKVTASRSQTQGGRATQAKSSQGNAAQGTMAALLQAALNKKA